MKVYLDYDLAHNHVSLWKHQLYRRWKSMNERCHLKSSKGYSSYGGRGIKVCDRWNSKKNGVVGFVNFVNDMGYPKSGQTLDRINNDGDYSPDNCRWADEWTQHSNTSYNSKVVGVNKNRNWWRAKLVIGGKVVLNRYFHNYEDAVRCRKDAEKRYGIIV